MITGQASHEQKSTIRTIIDLSMLLWIASIAAVRGSPPNDGHFEREMDRKIGLNEVASRLRLNVSLKWSHIRIQVHDFDHEPGANCNDNSQGR